MRFVFKIILNLQKIKKTSKNFNFKQFYNSPKLLFEKKSPEMRFVFKIILNLQQKIQNK
jgi:hypothetical protein